MRRVLPVVLATLISLLACGLVCAGGPETSGARSRMPHEVGPPLDPTLMGWKEQGVWYFLCTSPIRGARIPPHYLTYGPPPVPYCPPPPVMYGPPVKAVHK